MSTKSITIRIIDARQPKKPRLWWNLLVWVTVPGGLFWPGILAGSAAMQWAGFILFLLFTVICIARWLDEFKTPEEARKLIDKIEATE